MVLPQKTPAKVSGVPATISEFISGVNPWVSHGYTMRWMYETRTEI